MIVLLYLLLCINNHPINRVATITLSSKISIYEAFDRAKEIRHVDTVFIKVPSGDYVLDKPIIIDEESFGNLNTVILVEGENGGSSIFRTDINPKFHKENDSLWSAYIPKYSMSVLSQCFVNGKRRFPAQIPNGSETFSIKKVEKLNVTIQSDGNEVGTFCIYPTEKIDRSISSGSIITVYHGWVFTKATITKVDREHNFLEIYSKEMNYSAAINERSVFSISNCYDFLDKCGEFYFDCETKILYYKPYSYELINDVSLSIPLLQSFIVITGNKEKRINDLIFRNISFNYSAEGDDFLNMPPIQSSANQKASIMIDFADNVSFQNCNFSHIGSSAIWYRESCSNSSVTHCLFSDLGGGCIKIGNTAKDIKTSDVTNNITITNNIIRNGGYITPTSPGLIIFNASDNTVSHNDISDFRYSGISLGWTWTYRDNPCKRNIVSNNHIHHLGWGVLNDMGGIYTLGKSEGTQIINNYIHHILPRQYQGHGIYLDQSTTGVIVSNNIVFDCMDSGFFQHYGENNVIRNNIFMNQANIQLQANPRKENRSFIFTNNIIISKSDKIISKGWSELGNDFIIDYNLYYLNTDQKTILFYNLPFEQWQKKGKDIHSLIFHKDFSSIDSLNYFNTSCLLDRIHFVPFDYNNYGVFGSDDWRNRDQLDSLTLADFNSLFISATKDRNK